MILLAHRGLWRAKSERNTPDAFRLAFEGGYGIETDVRDRAGELVISHDAPGSEELMSFAELLSVYASFGCPGALAINVKADGLQEQITRELAAAGVTNGFVFDMSVPDGLKYLSTGLDVFTRESEYEREPAFYDQAAGVWMDCFKSDWIDAAAVRRHVDQGKAIALVSPELHGRPHLETWARWTDVAALPGVMLCTDYPDEALAFFAKGAAQ